MAYKEKSEIVTGTIDAAFPVAGQDNDSQGFRDNFSIIKAGLETAASEIGLLLTGTAKTDANNDFAGNALINANMQIATQQFFPAGKKETGDNISLLKLQWISKMQLKTRPILLLLQIQTVL